MGSSLSSHGKASPGSDLLLDENIGGGNCTLVMRLIREKAGLKTHHETEQPNNLLKQFQHMNLA